LNDASWFDSKPPSAAESAKARSAAESMHLTMEEEHALGGMFPALFSYADIIENTEGLEHIMMKVVEKPSILSVVGHLGVSINFMFDTANFGPEDLVPLGWNGSQPAYHFPIRLEINNRLALRVTFVVTSPRPPLLTCGGIVSMLAENPSDKSTYLTWRIISARCGEVLAE
jgi:hypothetical protein